MLYVFPTILVFKICKLKIANPVSTSIQRIRRSEYPEMYRPHLFVSIYELPADYVRLVLFAEDSDFFTHRGFHLGYISYAFRLNRKLGYKAYGASTVTQQSARTLFLTPRKTYARKAAELILSLSLELAISKERILELYLNYAELGPGIYGVAEAAHAYFRKLPSELSLEEMLSLVSIMPNPLLYQPDNFKSSRLLVRRYESLIRFSRHAFNHTPVLRSDIRRIESP